jgi:hypothetical protein
MTFNVSAATLTRRPSGVDLSHRGRGGTLPLPLWERSDAKRPGEGGYSALSKVGCRHSLQESA